MIRLFNEWPELPPETKEPQERHDWERMMPAITKMYNENVPYDTMIERLNIISSEFLRRKIGEWVKAGRLVQREHPRNRWKDGNDEFVRERLLAGVSPGEIGRQMGYSRTWISHTARRLGFRLIRKNTGHVDWVLDNPVETVV